MPPVRSIAITGTVPRFGQGRCRDHLRGFMAGAPARRGAGDFGCACSAYWQAAELGLKGENLGDTYYKAGMCERQRGNQSRASEAFKKCLEVGNDVAKRDCGKELGNLGGFR